MEFRHTDWNKLPVNSGWRKRFGDFVSYRLSGANQYYSFKYTNSVNK